MDVPTANIDTYSVTEQKADVPFAKEIVVLTKQEHIELKHQISFFKAQHHRALEREARLKKQLEHERAKVRDLTQRLYGKKSEKICKSEKQSTDHKEKTALPRGQQSGHAGHGRTPRPDLPVIEEVIDVNEADLHCATCGLSRRDLGVTDDASIIEIEVKAYTRKIKREKYGRCGCADQKGIVTAPAPPRLLNRNDIGVSVWVEILLSKYLYAQATHRLLKDFSSLGYPLSPGTVAGGLKRLIPLFEPLTKAMLDKHLSERLFHSDETGWKVFEKIDGKDSYRWYLWLMQSPSVAYYRMAPGRDAGVPMDHFSELEGLSVFLVCDRYSAYKKLADNNALIILAYCWAHVRRDFLDAARSWPELKDWMFSWVDAIGELYHLNKTRLAHWDEDKRLGEQSAEFTRYHKRLRHALSDMKHRCDTALQQPQLQCAQRDVLKSLRCHWSGLIHFAKHPQIAMDNNTAERGLRNPVTGRKRFYGSGSVWSAQLAAMMFTVLHTLELWGLNPRHWLREYLMACASNSGKAPSHLSPFLPWAMNEQPTQRFCEPKPQVPLQDSG